LKNQSIKPHSEVTPSSQWLRIHPGLGISLIDHLYNKLDAMYPLQWRRAHTNEASVQNWKETWADAFDKKGITREQIAVGISECLELYDWPPSLKQFLDACRTVKPAAHRNFSPALTHKSSPEVNKEGLRRLLEMADKSLKRIPA
jgi:hypothetical protein